ncbi:MAG: cytochrome b [Methylophaga sp.]|nr:MAG: cytochrome b [Methylophaga sp.]
MQLANNLKSYGVISILLHWGMAVLIIGLFILGEYMVDLTYYDAWYIIAPDLHRSFGILVLLLLALRLAWRLNTIHPEGIGKKWEQYVAIVVHRLFYILILTIIISGYLITTADGQAISVFGWFDVPATVYGFENQEDVAGEVHEVLTYILITLVVLHSLAALKHHFINHDATLRRMLRSK